MNYGISDEPPGAVRRRPRAPAPPAAPAGCPASRSACTPAFTHACKEGVVKEGPMTLLPLTLTVYISLFHCQIPIFKSSPPTHLVASGDASCPLLLGLLDHHAPPVGPLLRLLPHCRTAERTLLFHHSWQKGGQGDTKVSACRPGMQALLLPRKLPDVMKCRDMRMAFESLKTIEACTCLQMLGDILTRAAVSTPEDRVGTHHLIPVHTHTTTTRRYSSANIRKWAERDCR